MDRATGPITTRLRQVHGFHYHPLGRKSGVAVDEHGEYLVSIPSATVLAGAHGPSTTGFTISRWDGLNASESRITPLGVDTAEEKP